MFIINHLNVKNFKNLYQYHDGIIKHNTSLIIQDFTQSGNRYFLAETPLTDTIANFFPK